MTYGSESMMVVRFVEESILRRAEKWMLTMMCGVQLTGGVSMKELIVRLGLDSTIIEVVRQWSLRWLGHVVRKRMMIVSSRCLGLRLKVVEEREGQG